MAAKAAWPLRPHAVAGSPELQRARAQDAGLLVFGHVPRRDALAGLDGRLLLCARARARAALLVERLARGLALRLVEPQQLDLALALLRVARAANKADEAMRAVSASGTQQRRHSPRPRGPDDPRPPANAASARLLLVPGRAD